MSAIRKQIIGRLHEVASEANAAGLSTADVKEVVDASLKGDGSLYGEVPDAVKGLGKGKK